MIDTDNSMYGLMQASVDAMQTALKTFKVGDADSLARQQQLNNEKDDAEQELLKKERELKHFDCDALETIDEQRCEQTWTFWNGSRSGQYSLSTRGHAKSQVVPKIDGPLEGRTAGTCDEGS